MTIRSMTGFARVRADIDLGELLLEIKSVNHRYLEIFLRQPEELRGTEIAVRQAINSALGRGKVDVVMRLTGSAAGSSPLNFDDTALHRLAMAVEYMSERVPQLGKVDPLSLLRWPGVIEDTRVDDDKVTTQVISAVRTALEQLQQCRADEGRRLAEVLEDRMQKMEVCIEQIRGRLPEQNRRWREKLLERLNEMADMEPERRDQALVQFAQRADVDEELERLASHVAEVRAAMEAGKPIGRKLDFYMQEFNREANTLGSKAMDAEITRLAVELKVLIEQMREQVQNIE